MKPERFLVGDVIASSSTNVRNAQCAVVIASIEVDGAWVIQARYLLVGGGYDPTGIVFGFFQRNVMWAKVGFCNHSIHFSEAVFDPTPNPVTVYILPYNKVFVAYEPGRGFLTRSGLGAYWQWEGGVANAIWFASPQLAREAVAHWVHAHPDEGGPVTFVNPPSV